MSINVNSKLRGHIDDVKAILKPVLDKEPLQDVSLIEFMKAVQTITFKYDLSNLETIDLVLGLVLLNGNIGEVSFYEDGRV